MALIKCWECGQPVSAEAVQCPSCGAMRRKQVSVVRELITKLVLLVLCLLFAYYTALGGAMVPNSEATSASQVADAGSPMNDPTAAQRQEDERKAEHEKNKREQEEKQRAEREEMGLGDGKIVISACAEPRWQDDEPSPFQSCQLITENLLKSLLYVTRDRAVEIMGASGLADGDELSFICNYRHGEVRWEPGTGDIGLRFHDKKVVAVHAYFRQSGKLLEYQYDDRPFLATHCSDFSGYPKLCTRSLSTDDR